MRRLVVWVVGLGLCGLAPASAQAAFDPAYEARNFSKIQERFIHDHGTPDYRVLLATRGGASEAELATIQASDPERDMSGNLCAHHMDGCAGDVRYYSWEADGYGIRRPVIFTARDGAVVSGHVWATKAGPAVRPGVVITTGSVQAPEELYAFAASTLAKKGYVVLTYDVQGQGRTDTYGEGADRQHNVPSQAGPQAFVEGTQDALDFFLSSPASPYEPRTGARAPGVVADHRPKHARRVRARLADAANPLSSLVDPTRVGIVGHSLGAAAVSCVAAIDPRVKAVVGLDNLSAPAPGASCPGAGNTGALRIPALGMGADYGLTPNPNLSEPDPQSRNAGSRAYSAVNLDTAQLNLRGGTHYEFSYIPNPGFGATLRGIDLVAWYLGAWMDKHVKGDPSADARLLTTRWFGDTATAGIDPDADPNLFSRYLRSRVDVRTATGQRVTCEDVRSGVAGCAALRPDGLGPYSYLAESRTPDAASPNASSPFTGAAAGPAASTARFAQPVGLSAPRLASDVSRSSTFTVRVSGARVASLVDHYELEVATLPTGRYRPLRTGAGVPALRFRGTVGATHRFRARAIGRGAIAGPWRYATTIVPTDDRLVRARNPVFSGRWYRRTVRNAFRASVTGSTAAGARMSFRFRGSRVLVIGRRSPTGGRALAIVDGRSRLISFRGRGRRVTDRAVIASLAAPGRRLHTLTLRSLGRGVDVDALGVAP